MGGIGKFSRPAKGYFRGGKCGRGVDVNWYTKNGAPVCAETGSPVRREVTCQPSCLTGDGVLLSGKTPSSEDQ
jgi:hypothetical protein